MRPGFISNTSGNSAAEFALVLPVVVAFFFGIIDGGRYFLEVNRAEKATQAGARVAAVTDMVPQGLVTYSYSLSSGVGQGQPVDESYFPGVECTQTGSSVTCDWLSTPVDSFDLNPDSTAFAEIVDRMDDYMPTLTAENVEIVYGNSGLGFAGDPSGPDVAPFITVRLRDMEFQPILTVLFGATWGLPAAPYTITQEDGRGACYEEKSSDGCDS